MSTGPQNPAQTAPDLSIGPDLTPDLATGPLDAEPDDPRLGSALFVDDDAHTLMALRSGLTSSLPGWHLMFAGSGEQGLERIHGREVDVVVTAPELTDMSGARFLEQVRDLSPATRRVMLSDTADPAEPAHVRKAGEEGRQVANAVVTMPTDAPRLGEVIRTARELKWEQDDAHPEPQPVPSAAPMPAPRGHHPAHRR